MEKNYNVLIIEDHQIITDTFKIALNHIQCKAQHFKFNIIEVNCCQTAIEKIEEFSQLGGKIHLSILDINLPSSAKYNVASGEQIGLKINSHFPKSKIIVCTGISDNLRLINIIRSINPEGILIKGDIEFDDIILAIENILVDKYFFSETVINLLRKKAITSIVLEEFDIQILRELSNGSKMKELLKHVPLSKAGIEKRKRKMKNLFNLAENNDRELVMKARENGFI